MSIESGEVDPNAECLICGDPHPHLTPCDETKVAPPAGPHSTARYCADATARCRDWCFENAAYWSARAEAAFAVGQKAAGERYARFVEFWETAAD